MDATTIERLERKFGWDDPSQFSIGGREGDVEEADVDVEVADDSNPLLDSPLRNKSIDFMPTAVLKAGFTGERRDSAGRRMCFRDGKRVPCPKKEGAEKPKPGRGAVAAKASPPKTWADAKNAVQEIHAVTKDPDAKEAIRRVLFNFGDGPEDIYGSKSKTDEIGKSRLANALLGERDRLPEAKRADIDRALAAVGAEKGKDGGWVLNHGGEKYTLRRGTDNTKTGNGKVAEKVGAGKVARDKPGPIRPDLSMEQLGLASSKALDAAYGYGVSKPGDNFGWAANQGSVKAFLEEAKKTRDVEKLSAAIHDGWGKVALSYDDPVYQQKPEKRAAREKLANTPYAKLSEEEKQKDRVVALALLSEVRPPDYWGSKEQPYWRPGPNKTVDNVITRDGENGREILMIRRKPDSPTEGGKWALPGGFHDSDAKKGQPWKPGKETAAEAALRELKEETGLDADTLKANMRESGIYAKRGRDPRDNPEAWSESTAFQLHIPPGVDTSKIVGQDDADRAEWVPVSQLGKRAIAFDHADIIKDALHPTGEPSRGFTGERKDAQGRRRCYRDGKQVPCAKEEPKLPRLTVDQAKKLADDVLSGKVPPKDIPGILARVSEMPLNDVRALERQMRERRGPVSGSKQQIIDRLKTRIHNLVKFQRTQEKLRKGTISRGIAESAEALKRRDTPLELIQQDPNHPVAKSIREDKAAIGLVQKMVYGVRSKSVAKMAEAKDASDKAWDVVMAAEKKFGKDSPEHKAALKEWSSVRTIGMIMDDKKLVEAKIAEREKVVALLRSKSPPQVKIQIGDSALASLLGREKFKPTPAQKTAIGEGLRFVRSITEGKDFKSTIRFTESPDGRAYFSDRKGAEIGLGVAWEQSEADRLGMVKLGMTTGIVHELGHWIDNMKPGAKKKVEEFLAYRLGDEKAVDMATIPGGEEMKGEMVRRNHFDRYFKNTAAYYVGKQYKNGGTEIVSMGIEALYTDPVGFATKDPEYAAFIVQILKM